MGTTTTNLGIYKPTVGETGWGALVNASFDTLDVAAGEVFNVKHYGALGDGSTNDTAAIQAALDAAAAVRGTVLVPASDDPYMFSNLKMSHYSKLIGQGMGSTILKRITGSTGNALREKTVVEGNDGGASAMGLAHFTIQGNNTVGNGIDLGFQGGAQFTSGSWMHHVWVADFDSGVGMHINSNAEGGFFYLWAVQCQDGYHFESGGANQFYSLYAERNTRYQINVEEANDVFFGTQIESDISDTNPLIRNAGAFNTFNGVYLSYAGGATKPALVLNVTGANVSVYRDVSITGGGPYTHGILAESQSRGTGNDQSIHSFVLGDPSDGAEWYVNANGDVSSRAGGLTTMTAMAVEVTGLTYSASIALDAARTSIFRITATNGTAFTINNPSNSVTGQIITIEVRNNSGGALGTITWGGNFKMASGWTNPANGFRKTITFWYDSAAWMQMGAVSGDVSI